MKRTMPLLFTVIACTSTPDFEAEKQLFYKEANERGCVVIPMDIHFARLGSTAGYCVPRFGILLNETLWHDYGEFQRKELVFHELGHCVLQKDHEELGIMKATMHSEEHMEMMWKEYVDLLFKDCLSLADLIAPKDKKEPL